LLLFSRGYVYGCSFSDGKELHGIEFYSADPRNDSGRRVWKNLTCSSSQNAAATTRQFKFDKDRQLLVRTHNVTPSIMALCAAIQIVRPSRSKADTQQPQLQPALLRLSAVISQSRFMPVRFNRPFDPFSAFGLFCPFDVCAPLDPFDGFDASYRSLIVPRRIQSDQSPAR
jgi:hypothetical protein